MPIRLACLLLLVLPVISPRLAGQESATLENIRQQVTEQLLDEPVDQESVRTLITTLTPSGYWTDIDYRDTSRTGFDHIRHLRRLNELAVAYRRPGSPLYHDTPLKRSIDTALGVWLERDFRSANWWFNEIGVPQEMVRLLLVMDDSLSERQRRAAALIMARATLDAWGARPGGDLIKIAGIYGEYALFLRDGATLRRIVDTMAAEIRFAAERGTPEDLRGMQVDYSFQHRSDRVTSVLSYGLGYARAFAAWAALLADTPYAFPERATEQLVDFFLDGIAKSSAYGTYPDPGAKNRGLSRPGALAPYSADLPRKLLRATDYRAAELRALIDRRVGGTPQPELRSNRFYWTSEYLSHQRPTYFTSVRMYSHRNHSVEVPYNEEGLKNHYLADGANWLTRTGREYLDIFPLLDYRKIPGTTVVQKPDLPGTDAIQQRGLTDFVGGVSDGTYGAAAFDFVSPLDSLAARKAWFFFDDEYVCLGTGIRSVESDPVATTLDQRWLAGEVIVGTSTGQHTLASGTHAIDRGTYVWHDSVLYTFVSPTALRLVNDTVTGRWSDINGQSSVSRSSVSGKTFTLWIDHGEAPTEGTYSYTVRPGVGREAMTARSAGLSAPQIIANTTRIQSVSHPLLSLTQAVFYESGELRLPDGSLLRTAAPILLMIHHPRGSAATITVADPTHRLSSVLLTLHDEQRNIDLPQGVYAGQSVRVSW